MHPTHRFVPLEKVEAGMVLSDEVLDRQGHVLLPAGATVTADLIARLHAHGVSALPIMFATSATEEPIDRDAVLQRIAHVFRNIDPDDPAHAPARALRRAVETYRLGEALP